jgi:mannose-6-phosphate isomerase-like protein (cupin superfamily)
MLLLPLGRLIERMSAGHIAHVLGPEVVTPATVDDWRPGKLVRCAALDLHLARGPGRVEVAPSGMSWTLIVPLSGTVAAALADVHEPSMLAPGDLVLAAPGALVDLVLERSASVATLTAPPRSAATLSATTNQTLGAAPRGLSWLARRDALEQALAPRDKVKIAEPTLWRPEAAAGRWEAGTEIRCEAMSFGVFRTGAPESAHQHQLTWEIYYVLEGELRLKVRTYRLGSWESVVLHPLESLVLPPGAAHMVEQGCTHRSLAIQTPPAGPDREAVSVSTLPPPPA